MTLRTLRALREERMEKYINKARVLIEALPYIRLFKGQIIVIKFGGSIMESEESMKAVLQDIVFMKYAGWKPVIVHGGGPAISKAMKERKLETKFINGLRVTDQVTMDLVEDILGNKINSHIVNILDLLQVKAKGISGKTKNFILADPLDAKLGYVGHIRAVNAQIVHDILNSDLIPVIAPIGVDDKGKVYNINADIAAGEIASSLGARKLVFLTDTPGILADSQDSNSLISTLNKNDMEQMIKDEKINGGMIPKVSSCIKALGFGVNKGHIIDGRIDHSLLLEIFTKNGVGTEILA